MKKICYIVVLDRIIKYFIYPHINILPEDEFAVTVATDFRDPEALASINKPVNRYQISITRGINPVNMLNCIIRLTKEFKKSKYDVIQYTGPSTGLICSIAGRLAGVPHRVYCLWGIRYEGFSGIKRKIFRVLEKITCSLSTNIILDSNENRKFVIEEGVLSDKKSVTIRSGSACGVDLSVFDIKKKAEYRKRIRGKYKISEETFVFGYIGRIICDKGVNELFAAAKKLIEGGNKCVFMIVGFTEDTDGIDKDLLEWTKTCPHFIYCGRQDKPEEYYAAFDCFVFPSYREGFGGGVVQAGAFGVPSAVSDIRPLMDAIQFGEYGYYFKVNDAGSLYNKLEELYTHMEEAENMGKRMEQRVRDCFDMSDWMCDYSRYIQEILK